MSILSVDQIQPIGSGTTVTLNATEVKTGTEITVGTGASIFSPAGNTLALGTNNVERIRIKNDGKVGIGTVSPDRMLHLNGTGNALVKMEGDYSGSVTGIEGVLTASGANRYVTGVYGKVVNTSGSESNVASIRLWNEQASPTTSDSPGYITFNTTNDGASTATEKVRIASSGQIGLGGANYGTAGQVITSNGSSSAPTYQYVNRPAFKAIVSNQASIPHAAWTKVIFDNEVFDTDNAYNPTTGIFTCPTGQDGVYLLSMGVGVDDLNTGEYLQMRPYKNGNGINNGRTIQFAGNPHSNLVVDARSSTIIRLDAGDELAIWIYHNEGGAIPLEANRCEFQLFKLNTGNI